MFRILTKNLCRIVLLPNERESPRVNRAARSLDDNTSFGWRQKIVNFQVVELKLFLVPERFF